MSAHVWVCRVVSVLLVLALVGCASSEIATYDALSSADVAKNVSISRDSERTVFTAPKINTRASFGEFSKGMMTGGSNFSSAITLQGEQTPDNVTTHWLYAEVVYTNLGGIYRDYDRAGIEGIAKLNVVPVSMDRHYNINSVNMTEIVKIEIAEAELRAREASGLILRLMDDSDNLIEFNVPPSYIGGYLLSLADHNVATNSL